jgi:UDP-GlcNAc3NAcA epimerase
MYDNALHYGKIAEQRSGILGKLDIENTGFILFTLHRDLNTDVPERLNAIMGALNDISLENEACLVLPLHPRTRKMLPLILDEKLTQAIESNRFFRIIDPVSYFDMIMLEKNCRMVITDSGGVQKEAYFFRKPCLVLRGESEWKELMGLGAAITVDADPFRIKKGFGAFYNHPPDYFPEIFGDGRASEFIPGEFV